MELSTIKTFAENDQWEEAYTAASLSIAEGANDLGTIELLALAGLNSGNFKDAYMQLARLRTRPGTDFRVNYYLGFILGNTEAREVSRSQYIQDINSDQFTAGRMMQLGGILETEGNLAGAKLVAYIGEIFAALLNGKQDIDLRQRALDFSLLISELEKAPFLRATNKNQVCFVAKIFSIRVQKLAHTLRYAGKEVILITHRDQNIPKEAIVEFSGIVTYSDFVELHECLKSFSPSNWHLFITSGDGFVGAMSAYLRQPKRCIIDIYDISDPDIGPLARLEEGSEHWKQYVRYPPFHRFFLNHIPGICARTLYSNFQKSKLPGAKTWQHRIYLPDLPWGTTPTQQKLSDQDGKLHIVYGGSFFNEFSYGSNWAGLYELGRLSEEFDIHFHLYADIWGGADLDAYEELARKTPNFHLNQALSYEKWKKELELFDIGLFHIHPLDPSLEGNTPRTIIPSGIWANKFGDYIDAELYIVCSWATKAMAGCARHYGVGQSIMPDQLLSREFWREIRTKVIDGEVDFSNAREKLAVRNHGARLIEFYETVNAKNP